MRRAVPINMRKINATISRMESAGFNSSLDSMQARAAFTRALRKRRWTPIDWGSVQLPSVGTVVFVRGKKMRVIA